MNKYIYILTTTRCTDGALQLTGVVTDARARQSRNETKKKKPIKGRSTGIVLDGLTNATDVGRRQRFSAATVRLRAFRRFRRHVIIVFYVRKTSVFVHFRAHQLGPWAADRLEISKSTVRTRIRVNFTSIAPSVRGTDVSDRVS